MQVQQNRTAYDNEGSHETIVVRTALKSRAHSHHNRRRAKDLAWGWVGAKWPRLMPSASELERAQIQIRLADRSLTVSTDEDGAVWMLEVAHGDKNAARSWITRVLVADTGEADVMALQTACTDLAAGPTVIAPPRLLSAWVDRLDLEDGGLAVAGEPRPVSDPAQLAAFCDHVLSADRALPVIALTNKPKSRYYGVDPRGLAEAVRGLAHVACLTPEIAMEAGARLGMKLAPVPGVPRIYASNFSPAASSKQHPLIRMLNPPATPAGTDPSALRRLVCRKVCLLSTQSTAYQELLGAQV